MSQSPSTVHYVHIRFNNCNHVYREDTLGPSFLSISHLSKVFNELVVLSCVRFMNFDEHVESVLIAYF